MLHVRESIENTHIFLLSMDPIRRLWRMVAPDAPPGLVEPLVSNPNNTPWARAPTPAQTPATPTPTPAPLFENSTDPWASAATTETPAPLFSNSTDPWASAAASQSLSSSTLLSLQSLTVKPGMSFYTVKHPHHLTQVSRLRRLQEAAHRARPTQSAQGG